jgi:hypothetical protein
LSRKSWIAACFALFVWATRLSAIVMPTSCMTLFSGRVRSSGSRLAGTLSRVVGSART